MKNMIVWEVFFLLGFHFPPAVDQLSLSFTSVVFWVLMSPGRHWVFLAESSLSIVHSPSPHSCSFSVSLATAEWNPSSLPNRKIKIAMQSEVSWTLLLCGFAVQMC